MVLQTVLRANRVGYEDCFCCPDCFNFFGTLVVWHVVTGAAWPLSQEYPIGVLGLYGTPLIMHMIVVVQTRLGTPMLVCAKVWPTKDVVSTTASAIDLCIVAPPFLDNTCVQRFLREVNAINGSCTAALSPGSGRFGSRTTVFQRPPGLCSHVPLRFFNAFGGEELVPDFATSGNPKQTWARKKPSSHFKSGWDCLSQFARHAPNLSKHAWFWEFVVSPVNASLCRSVLCQHYAKLCIKGMVPGAELH